MVYLFFSQRCPLFFIRDANSEFYVIPIHGIPCFKIGIDAGGRRVTADSRTFEPDLARENAASNCLKKYFPKVLMLPLLLR